MMTADTQIKDQVVEPCALDLTSQLPSLPDSNGNSYVFVSGNHDPNGNAALVSDNSVAVEDAQNVELLHSSASGVESSWVFEGTEVAASSNNNSPADKTHDDDDSQVAITGEAAQHNVVRVGSLYTVRPQDHENNPISSPQDEEKQESQVGVLELDAASPNNVQPDISSLDIVESTDINQESQEKNDFDLTIGLGEGEERQDANCCKSSHIGILVSGCVDSMDKPVESIDINKKSLEENLNLEPAGESGEGGEYAGVKLEEEIRSQIPSDAKQNQETITLLGENGKIPDIIPEPSESQVAVNLSNDGEKLEEETKSQIPSDAEQNQKTITLPGKNGKLSGIIPEPSESHVAVNLANDGEKLEEETKSQIPPDAELILETITLLGENGKIPDIIPEPSESQVAVNLANDGEKVEEETKYQIPSDAEQNQENITLPGENGKLSDIIPEPSESNVAVNLANDGEKLEEETKSQIPPDAELNQETITLLGENDKIPDIIPEPSESHVAVNLANDEEKLEENTNDGEKLEDETNTHISSDAKENQENQESVTAFGGENGDFVADLEHKFEKSVNEVKLPLGKETTCSHVLAEIECPVSSFNDSVPENQGSFEHIDTSERTPELQKSSESNDNLILVVDTQIGADTEIGQSPVENNENVLVISTENVAAKAHDEIIKPETGAADNVAEESTENAFDLTREHGMEDVSSCLTKNDTYTVKEVNKEESTAVKHVNNTSTAGGDSTSCSEFELETPHPEVSTFQVNDVHLKPEVSIVDVKSADLQSLQFEVEKEFDVGSSSIISSRDIPCSDVFDSSITKDELPVLENLDTESSGGHLSGEHLIIDHKLTRQETKDVEISLSNPKSMPLIENSSVVEPLTRPFNFLIRMPRFEDLKMKEEIIRAQLLVEEKTQHRDAFRIEVQKYKANCFGYAAEYDAANSESRALKRSVKAKRAEIDSLQSVINKVKNAISVDDIDTRIHSMEHMIEHETLPLKEEKLLIREIKQLKQLREQLSSNIGSQDEIQQALNDKDQIEKRLKVLKKELDILKESVLKADAIVRALEKKYGDENKKVKEVQTRYSAANNVRQDAYAHLQSLRKRLFEKNQQFRTYKENAAAASNYAMKRDRDALHHLCINQVESVMELWNKNDEFRMDYVRCNMRSTLRRLGTLDGRSLGPDEHSPVLTSFADGRGYGVVSNPVNSSHLLQPSQNLEQVVKPGEGVSGCDKTKVNEFKEMKLFPRPEKQEKPVLENGLATISGREISDEIREEQLVLTSEELELARRVEELRKEEAAAKMKEQRRLEEKAKAAEALERKKRNAEKAQLRAELRAQKEAEQREKEREKRLRKKERKMGPATEVPDSNSVAETNSSSESLSETTKEGEIKENAAASASASKRSQKKPSQFSKAKSIPPPLRNRSRRKLQQWMWVILTCLVVVALFLLGNLGLFSNLSSFRRRNSGF